MGLDTTHDCWHGAYSAFMRWRQMIARAAGIPLMFMENYYGDMSGGPVPAWAKYAYRTEPDSVFREAMERDLSCFPIKWAALKPDVLHVLLNHSDCEGTIPARYCARLADRLEELLPTLEAEGDGGGHIGSYADKARTFIKGLRLAAERREAVEFH